MDILDALIAVKQDSATQGVTLADLEKAKALLAASPAPAPAPIPPAA